MSNQITAIQERLKKIKNENPLKAEPVDAEIPFPDAATLWANETVFSNNSNTFEIPNLEEVQQMQHAHSILEQTVLSMLENDKIAKASLSSLTIATICPQCGK